MKFTLMTLLVIGLLGAGGYFALVSFKDPTAYIPTTNTKIGDLHRIETDPQTMATASESPEPVLTETVPSVAVPVTQSSPVSTDLKTNIQAMITNKVTLKAGSKGANVGYVQTFMNKYFKKALKVDNDFGPTLEANVKAFQKATGVTQTGQIGPATLGKMVDWLTKNPQ